MNLKALLHFFEKQEQLSISFYGMSPRLNESPELQLGMEHLQHHLPTCVRFKQADNSHSCAQEKWKAIRQATECRSPFTRTCRYGVTEKVFPAIADDGQLLAVFFIADIHAKSSEAIDSVGLFLTQYVRILAGISRQAELEKRAENAEQLYLSSCHDFIERHYAEDIRLNDLARVLHVNSNYLCGVLRRLTGTTFRKMLVRRRLQEAAQWLLFKKDHSIARVAFACGFNDSNYFAVVFRKAFGVTPSEYRLSGGIGLVGHS